MHIAAMHYILSLTNTRYALELIVINKTVATLYTTAPFTCTFILCLMAFDRPRKCRGVCEVNLLFLDFL